MMEPLLIATGTCFRYYLKQPEPKISKYLKKKERDKVSFTNTKEILTFSRFRDARKCFPLWPLYPPLTLYKQAMSSQEGKQRTPPLLPPAPLGRTSREIKRSSSSPHFAAVFYLLPSRPPGWSAKCGLIRGRRDRLEDMMNVADENEAAAAAATAVGILSHANSLLQNPLRPPSAPLLTSLAFFHHLAFSKSREATAKANEPWPQADAPHISGALLPLDTLHFPQLT